MTSFYDLHYILIRRELPPDRRVTVVSADLDAALREPGSAADVPLMARDRITVFDLQSSRDRVIHPLIDDLREQSNIGRPEEIVRIDGRANVHSLPDCCWFPGAFLPAPMPNTRRRGWPCQTATGR